MIRVRSVLPSTCITSGGIPSWSGRSRAAARRGRLFAYHICDWLVPTTDLLNDRGMMGDGVIDLRRIRSWMEAAGYRGQHEVEIFSNRWWRTDPEEVLRTCVARHAAAS